MAVVTLALLLAACNPAKKLQPGEYLVDRVDVENVRQTNIPKENFEAFYRLKPNRKFLRKIHFFVWWYNLFDNRKIEERKVRRNQRYDQKNARKVKRIEKKNIERAKKGKRPRVPRLKDKESPTFFESMRDIGEPAVVLDSILVAQTRIQLSRYLFTKGYYNNTVTDTVTLNRRKKKATITYRLEPGKPYFINNVIYRVDDPGLEKLVLGDSANRVFSKGMQYDAEKLSEERQRITDLARNNGYYNFENAYTTFDLDSAFNNRTVAIFLNIAKFSRPYSSAGDSMVQVDHTRYTIDNVYVITEPVIGNVRDANFPDTLDPGKKGVIFLLRKPLAYKPALLLDNIDIYKGQVFRKDSAQQTYKQLLGLGTFKTVIVSFLQSTAYPDRLDCYIICIPLIRQSITAETEGTNTFGNLGIDGSLNYQNRNSFRGGELLELRLQGSIAAQSQLRVVEDDPTVGQLPRTFNTIQFGPEFSFSVPRAFFPFSLLPFRRDMSPRTYVKSSFNYQRRPDFSRTITSLDYGFSFKTHNNLLRHDFTPAEIYFVRANLTQQFRQTLDSLHDAFLVNSFQDHVTTLSRYTLTYFSKENLNTSRRTVHYVRWSIQSSGSVLRKAFELTDQPRDSLNRFLIYGIPFAHFLRTDADYRIYIPVRKRSRIVYRVAGGIGKPLVNLSVLPYEQSFFSGGPNSVRAWRARTLGPGGYDPSLSGNETRYDKIGDILLEGNVEYRFHIIKAFNGAFFVDAGNIWRLYPDDSKPNGEFQLNTFVDQIAIGGGFGVRWDLNFFVIRLDLAMPLKDPRLSPKNRWTFFNQPVEERAWNRPVFNFGIGYPF